VLAQIFEEGKNPLILILDGITDVRNFGGLARTAECLGVDAILIPTRGGAQVNPDAIKTSAGALNYIPVCRSTNLKESITYLKDSGLQIVACTEKTDILLGQVDFKAPTALIMGSEDEGVSGAYLGLSDVKAKIHMTGRISSLNVAAATAMALYEIDTQRS
jgi:23S rRNA (guanosine2251-2'-O)-methyltransferase